MTSLKDYISAVLLIAVSVNKGSCEESDSKGEASVRSGFRSFPQYEKLSLPPHKTMPGKTTVEYWPPDLDKKKFYNLKKDSVMELWPKDMKHEMRIRINERITSAPDYLPDIPINISDIPINSEKFEALLKPTETSLIEEMAITNRSPIIFPTSESTTRSPDREVAFVSRGGNKKRKLKKKVKPAAEVPSAKIIESFTLPMDSVIEIMPNGEQPKIPQVTPIYEYIDEPVVNIFQPIRYTDVISNLSNLTALTFGSSNNTSSNVVQVIDPIVEDFKIANQFNASSTINGALEINLNVNNDLSPIDIMLNQLKLAIEERDLTKIKSIVKSMDEDEEKLKEQKADEEKALEKTTEAMLPLSSTISTEEYSTKSQNKIYLAPKVRTSSVFTTGSSTTSSGKVYLAPKVRTSTVPATETSPIENNKVYIAPQVRAGQKKLKQVKAKSLPDENLKETSSASATEIPITSTTALKVTTEKRTMTAIVKADPLNARPTKRKRSHITTRTRHNIKAATRSGHQKNIARRRSERKF